MKGPLKPRDVLFVTGGGTAGHIYAGIAVADHWKQLHPATEIHFVGARGGMEEKLVPRSPYPLHLVSIGSWNGAPIAKRLRTLFQIPLSFLSASRWLLRHRPRVVLGVGGYASFPLVLAASLIGWLWGCRVAVLEQNVLPGLTNRVLGRFASRVFAAFPGAEDVFGKGKLLVTGNPIRSVMRPLPPARRDPFTVFVFGGSQGAIGINSLVIDCLPELSRLGTRVRWIHQTGEKDFERVASAHRAAGADSRVERFIYEMLDAYAQSDLLICRAGSSTLAEVAAVGRAAILVPLVSRDRHQVYNAELFARTGAARMKIQTETSGRDLALLIDSLSRDQAALASMEKSVGGFYRPDAVSRIVGELQGGGA